MTIHAQKLEGGPQLPFQVSLQGESRSRSSEIQVYLEAGNRNGPRITFEAFGAGQGGRIWLKYQPVDITPDGRPVEVEYDDDSHGLIRRVTYLVTGG